MVGPRIRISTPARLRLETRQAEAMARKRKSRATGAPRRGGGARNPASLRNLIPGGPRGAAAEAGNQRALTHGASSALLVKDVSAEVAELRDALSEAAPVQEDGSPPAADVAALEAAARALKRYRHISNWCDLHGRLDSDGEVRPAAQHELAAERSLLGLLDSLGMTPQSRSKLGLRLVQVSAVAADAEDQRHARERLDRRLEALDAAPAAPDEDQRLDERERDEDAAEQRVQSEDQPGDSDAEQGDPSDQQGALGSGHGRSVSGERPTK
jgi:hypothetical protein